MHIANVTGLHIETSIRINWLELRRAKCFVFSAYNDAFFWLFSFQLLVLFPLPCNFQFTITFIVFY